MRGERRLNVAPKTPALCQICLDGRGIESTRIMPPMPRGTKPVVHFLSEPLESVPKAETSSSRGNPSPFSEAEENSCWRSPIISFRRVVLPPMTSLIDWVKTFFFNLWATITRRISMDVTGASSMDKAKPDYATGWGSDPL